MIQFAKSSSPVSPGQPASLWANLRRALVLVAGRFTRDAREPTPTDWSRFLDRLDPHKTIVVFRSEIDQNLKGLDLSRAFNGDKRAAIWTKRRQLLQSDPRIPSLAYHSLKWETQLVIDLNDKKVPFGPKMEGQSMKTTPANTGALPPHMRATGESILETSDLGPDLDMWVSMTSSEKGNPRTHFLTEPRHLLLMLRGQIMALKEHHKLGFSNNDAHWANYALPFEKYQVVNTKEHGEVLYIVPKWDDIRLFDWDCGSSKQRCPPTVPFIDIWDKVESPYPPTRTSNHLRLRIATLMACAVAHDKQPYDVQFWATQHAASADLLAMQSMGFQEDLYAVGFWLKEKIDVQRQVHRYNSANGSDLITFFEEFSDELMAWGVIPDITTQQLLQRHDEDDVAYHERLVGLLKMVTGRPKPTAPHDEYLAKIDAMLKIAPACSDVFEFARKHHDEGYKHSRLAVEARLRDKRQAKFDVCLNQGLRVRRFEGSRLSLRRAVSIHQRQAGRITSWETSVRNDHNELLRDPQNAARLKAKELYWHKILSDNEHWIRKARLELALRLSVVARVRQVQSHARWLATRKFIIGGAALGLAGAAYWLVEDNRLIPRITRPEVRVVPSSGPVVLVAPSLIKQYNLVAAAIWRGASDKLSIKQEIKKLDLSHAALRDVASLLIEQWSSLKLGTTQRDQYFESLFWLAETEPTVIEWDAVAAGYAKQGARIEQSAFAQLKAGNDVGKQENAWRRETSRLSVIGIVRAEFNESILRFDWFVKPGRENSDTHRDDVVLLEDMLNKAMLHVTVDSLKRNAFDGGVDDVLNGALMRIQRTALVDGKAAFASAMLTGLSHLADMGHRNAAWTLGKIAECVLSPHQDEIARHAFQLMANDTDLDDTSVRERGRDELKKLDAGIRECKFKASNNN